jgi:hypothetical protein
VSSAVRNAVRAAGVASVAAALAGLGLPAVAVAAGVVVLLLAAVCWVVGSRDRSDHLARIILGLRGDARCLYSPATPEHDALSAPAAGSPDGQSRAALTGHGLAGADFIETEDLMERFNCDRADLPETGHQPPRIATPRMASGCILNHVPGQTAVRCSGQPSKISGYALRSHLKPDHV